MERTINKNDLHPDCPIRNILSRINDKWTLLVFYTLRDKESIRYGELKEEISDISPKMLSLTLKTLETDGYIRRTVYAEVPPRVEYQLTDRAHTLLPIINQLIHWAKQHMDEILLDRTKAMSK